MNVIPTALEGVFIIEPRVFKDARGYFFESFSQRDFDAQVAPLLGHTIQFVQDNESMSSYGVVRGLHFQNPPFTQSKLVRCVAGRVLDVAVDIRRGSPTFGQHVAVEISEENHLQFFIPKGLPCSARRQSSSTNATSSTTRRPTPASSWPTPPWGSTGRFPRSG